ncbi:MAG: NfeD family protein [Solirubrobacterales bacterium]
MSSSTMLWVIIAAAGIAIDLVTSAFLFVWFAAGSIAAIIALMLKFSFTVQLIVFISVSAVSMAIGYPIVKRTLKKTVKKTKTMEEGYIGRIISIDDEISERAHIKIDGIYWLAKIEGEPLKRGDKAKIIGIEGNKIVIKKHNE